MPKTTVQQIIFGLLMSYFMAIGMEIYNTAINSGVTQLAGGFSALSYEVILDALKEASYMGIIVFIISELFGNKIGAGFMARYTMRCFSGAAGRSKAPADRPGCARSPHTARKR